MRYFLCNCGKKAIWEYAPGFSSKSNPYFCDDCVHRGCSCNEEWDDPEHDMAIADTIKWYEEQGMKWKWKEEGVSTVHVDELGRELPCCEYDYDEEGCEVIDKYLEGDYLSRGVQVKLSENM